MSVVQDKYKSEHDPTPAKKPRSIWLVVDCKHDEELEDLDDKIKALEEKLVEIVKEAVKGSPIEGNVSTGISETNLVESAVRHLKRNRSL